MNEFNKGHWFEAMDRAHTLMVMLDQLLTDHPAIVKAGLEEDVSDVHKGLWDIYQKMGVKEFEITTGDEQDLRSNDDSKISTGLLDSNMNTIYIGDVLICSDTEWIVYDVMGTAFVRNTKNGYDMNLSDLLDDRYICDLSVFIKGRDV